MADESTLAKHHQELATRNSLNAAQAVIKLRTELVPKIQQHEQIIRALLDKVADLERKYNLLLSARFNGGSTSGDNG